MEMLSDDGDLYSDDDEPTASYIHASGGSSGDSSRHDRSIPSAADRRAHHNALERKRRDHIKDSFSSLRDSVPSLQGEKASRAQILKKAAEYIQFMRKKNVNVQTDIEEIKKQNKMLEEQIRLMEKQRPGFSSSSTSTPTPVSIPYSSIQSLSLLSSGESINGVSPTYCGDISENSNESTSNDLVIINGVTGNVGRRIDSPVSLSSNGGNNINSTIQTTTIRQRQQPTQPLTTQQAQLLINGTSTATVRSMMKNGTSTIIVQNPQIKSIGSNSVSSTGQHVIHVTSSNNSHVNINNNNNSNITATATPIIISTSSLANAANGNNGAGATMVPNTGSGNTYTVLNKGPSALSLATTPTTHNGAYRTVMVQPAQQPHAGTTTTPNIHIVSTIPSTYAGRTTTTKRFKISTENNNSIENTNNNNNSTSSSSGSIISGGTVTISTTTSVTTNPSTAQPQTFNVTPVSS